LIKLKASTVPTETPSSQWEMWTSDIDDMTVTSDADGINSTQNSKEDNTSKTIVDAELTTEEEEGGQDQWDGWAVDNWQSRENEKEDFRWWIAQNSSRMQMHSLLMTTALWALFYVAGTS